MKTKKIEIIVENRERFQLVNTNLQDFFIFSLKKSMSFNSTKISSDDYQTFLIVKSVYKYQVEQHLGFVKLKVGQTKSERNNTELGFMKSESYYSTFLRHINLLYCQKLSQLFQILNIRNQFPLSNEWLLLYQVHNFKIQQNRIVKLTIQPPTYGRQVQIWHSFKQDENYNEISASQISNLFRRDNQNFYFISQPAQKKNIKSLDVVCSMRKKQIYGLTIKFNELLLCFPFYNVLFEKCCEVKIAKEILSNLYRTCYVQYFGNYCSGIYLQTNTIISTRHLLPISDQKIGIKIYIRLFPYINLTQGIIKKIGTDNFDIIQIQLIQNDLNFVSDKRIAKEKILLKHPLMFQELNQFDNTNQSKKQNSQFLENKIKQEKSFEIGTSVYVFGFGKYSYNNAIFSKFEIILPTISTGIISKLIKVKNQLVFIKTDAKLYNGFSGSGIWGDSLKGMAVFILKNKNNQSHYNRHNFSYSINFIQRLLSQKKCMITYEHNKQLQEFDKIQTRKKFKVHKLTNAKL